MSQQQPMCARCGNPMDASRATYDKGGHLVCQFCAAQMTIAEGENRASASRSASSPIE